MNAETLLFEELTCNSVPALQTLLYDGWVLRFANGYCGRANSVGMLYPSTLDIQLKINECEKIYSARGLNTLFKLTDNTAPVLDTLLAGQGYETARPTSLMAMDITDKNFDSADCVITSYADDVWLEAYCNLSEYEHGDNKTNAKLIMDNTKNPASYIRIVKNGVTIACGSTVVERGYAALLNIVVDKYLRGYGYGKLLCTSLLNEAKKLGAETSYLQVMQNNETAVKLYESLGYTHRYTYWYRVKEFCNENKI